MRYGVLSIVTVTVGVICAATTTARGDQCGSVNTGTATSISAGTPPIPTNWTGGAIEAGTYHIKSYVFYNAGCPFVPSGNDAVGMTITPSSSTGGTIVTAFDLTSGSQHSALTQSGTYTTSPAGNITYNYTCPKANSFTGHYTATPTANGTAATITTWSLPPLCGTYYQTFSK